ncbi:hypothetical protein LENED_002725 [Lentinula edodes]|uniref:Proteasome assembly chaperone 3 n=1 Tax=Lentinula edodes TaxID=5353 RepID=A0A1Q3E1V6_LENED|nr:hypothetical protein LENED_002725 [Lentinula edodes]
MHPSRNCTTTLYGVPTEISLQYYGDSTLILVTQVGKVGNLVSLPATIPVTPSAPDTTEPNSPILPPPPIAIQLTPLFGSAPSDRIQTLHNLYASQIATIIWLAETENPLQVVRKNVVVDFLRGDVCHSRTAASRLKLRKQVSFTFLQLAVDKVALSLFHQLLLHFILLYALPAILTISTEQVPSTSVPAAERF